MASNPQSPDAKDYRRNNLPFETSEISEPPKVWSGKQKSCSSPISVRYNGLCCVTMEINPKTKQVIQARGVCNREADIKEQNAIAQWIKTVVHSDTPV